MAFLDEYHENIRSHGRRESEGLRRKSREGEEGPKNISPPALRLGKGRPSSRGPVRPCWLARREPKK